MRGLAVGIAGALLVSCAADSGSPGDATTTEPSTTTSSTSVAVVSGPPPDAGLLTVGEAGADLLAEPGGSSTGRIRAGVVMPYGEVQGGYGKVLTPCSNEAWVDLADGTASGPYRAVIDPGHGGDEPGATGPGGLTEAEVNLDVGRQVVALLNDAGIPAVLTRAADYRATLKFRVQVAVDAGAEAFVSIHHNAEPDEERETPGTETYYQYRSADSKRLTGLVHEEVYAAYDGFDVTFAADFDAGAKYRLSGDQRDYYGVIRRTFEAGIAATLLESGFISNPQEEALLRRDDVRRREAEAIAVAIERYFRGEQPGDVFTEPYPRTEPAGSGGGPEGCEEPS